MSGKGEVGWGRKGKGSLVSQKSVKGPYVVESSKIFDIYPEWIGTAKCHSVRIG